MCNRNSRFVRMALVLCLSSASFVSFASTNGGVTLTNIAADPASGLLFERARSATFAVTDLLRQQSLVEPLDPGLSFIPTNPFNTYGQSGVAILDYDRDGDLDIYVTNGPGAPNSLFSNQLMETGATTFVDVAVAAGVDATSLDGMGVCYGDINNDGYDDLLVLGRDDANRLFQNQGDGTFVQITDSGLEGGNLSSPSCAMGDVNGDGFIDVVIANSFDHGEFIACVVEPFSRNQHNQLFLNQRDNTFVDVSETSGVQDLAGFPPAGEGAAGITWAVGMVDIDLDGDIDIIFADDQCGIPAVGEDPINGVDRGFIHVLLNDGAGHFTDNPIIVNDVSNGSWMGLAFGDLNCDGNLDIFGSNFGDYSIPVFGVQSSRWFLGNGDGTFVDSVANGDPTVFGWGNGIFDYDNDGDQDIVYHGGLDSFIVIASDNPGVVLQNQNCNANFVIDINVINRNALPVDHSRRTIQGVALGDLDRNGFVDVVAASSFDMPSSILQLSPEQFGSPLDATAFFVEPFIRTQDGFVWDGIDFLSGSLTVELNSGDNGNKWAQVTVLGTIDLTSEGRVNRGGIGAVVSFTPQRFMFGEGLVDGDTVLKPVVAGSSFGSQHSLEAGFGLGSAKRGRVDVMWPGGVRNRLYNVKAFERIVFPEIPCTIDADQWASFAEYHACVTHALNELKSANILTQQEKIRFKISAIIAFFQEWLGL